MAVIDEYILAAGVSGDAKGRESGNAKVAYVVRYRAVCDSPTDTPKTVIDHFRRKSGLPYIGSYYQAGGDSDRAAICTALSPSLVDKSGGMYDVDVTYEPADGGSDEQKPSGGNPSKTTSDPRLWHDELEVSYSQISIPCERAVFQGFKTEGAAVKNRFMKVGKFTPITNSVPEPLDPTIEYEIDIKIVRIFKYGATFPGDASNRWIGAVNSDAVTVRKPAYGFVDTWGPLTARIKGLPSTFGVANGIPYWRNGIEVHVSPLSWRRLVLDRGDKVRQAEGDRRFTFDGSGGIISPSEVGRGSPMIATITDEEGYPISAPVLLDGNGQVLEKGKPAVWLEYQTYEERSFAGIRW